MTPTSGRRALRADTSRVEMRASFGAPRAAVRAANPSQRVAPRRWNRHGQDCTERIPLDESARRDSAGAESTRTRRHAATPRRPTRCCAGRALIVFRRGRDAACAVDLQAAEEVTRLPTSGMSYGVVGGDRAHASRRPIARISLAALVADANMRTTRRPAIAQTSPGCHGARVSNRFVQLPARARREPLGRAAMADPISSLPARHGTASPFSYAASL